MVDANLVDAMAHGVGLDGAAIDGRAETLGDLVGRGAAQMPVADHRGLDPAMLVQFVEGVGEGADPAGVQDQVTGWPREEMGIAEALAAVLWNEEDVG
jgi:hypothetical protein